MQHIGKILAGLAVSLFVIGCMGDPTPRASDDDKPLAVEQASAGSSASKSALVDEDASTELALNPSSTSVVPATSGCAFVRFCDAPGSIGTDCVQTGCSLAAAKGECLVDLKALGCSVHCPAIIEKIGGGTSPLCSPECPCSPGCPCVQ